MSQSNRYTFSRSKGQVLARAAALAGLLTPIFAVAQVTAPRYHSPIEAPTQQLKLPTPAPVSSPNAAIVEDVIARVNDQIIDRSDVERQETRLQESVQQGKMTSADAAEVQHNLLRDMIDEQLLLSRGKELDVNVDAEVVRQLDEIRKQNHLDSMDALEKAVRESGISYEDWRADMRNNLVRQTVVRDEVGRTMHRPTTSEEQAFYDAHKAEFEQPEQVRLSEILIPTPDNATDAQVAQAQAKATEVAAKLKSGDKFDALAKQYSGGQTADKGGDLGMFKRGQLAKVLEDQTFPLQPGQWTAPIRTRQGFVVLEVTGHTAAGAPPLKDVEEQVQEAMYNDQMQPALRKYLTGLREKAYIDIAPGFVDTGASPNEVKPAFASNTPPPLKKKPAAQKERFVAPRTAAEAAEAAPKPATPPASSTASSTAPSSGAIKPVAATGKKRKKIRREKIRFGQAPQNALPEGAEQTAAVGADQGPGATSSELPSTTAPIDQMSAVASTDTDPLAPTAPTARKTRYSARAATEAQTKAAEKAAKVRQKALETPTPVPVDEKLAQNVQNSALGLEGDNATKPKKKKVKGAPKERLQNQPPAPPAPKPVETPIPPKSVRDNGEPAVAPASADQTTLPAATPPASGAPLNSPPVAPTDTPATTAPPQ